jgi:CheY-like chemotaxis protein
MADPVVLIVDDNEDNRFTLSMRLESCGHENIVSAETRREALEKMRERPVDLVLLDIMMPELDGYGVLEEMHRDTALRDIPVMMISALEDIDSVVRCIEKARYKAQAAAHLARIESERPRADELLTTVLPRSIARALKLNGRLAPQRYEDVAVLFCDVVGFTAYSERHPPETVFAELEALVDRFEEIAQGRGLEKIKTVGDAFMRPQTCCRRSTSRCMPRSPAHSRWWRQPSPRRGSRNLGGRAASTSAVALGCRCTIGHRAARWDLLT